MTLLFFFFTKPWMSDDCGALGWSPSCHGDRCGSVKGAPAEVIWINCPGSTEEAVPRWTLSPARCFTQLSAIPRVSEKMARLMAGV